MGDVKNCPLCGNGEAKITSRLEVNKNKVKTLYQVRCSNCGASSGEYDSSYGALIDWDAKVTVADGVAVLAECGIPFGPLGEES